MEKYYSALFLIFLLDTTLIAQTLQRDSAFVSSAGNNATRVYFKTMKDQTQLCNGGDYVDYKSQKDEHPYFISQDWISGSIQYNNEGYDSVPLLYNIYTDQVITEQSSIMIQLIRDKIQFFSVDGHQFVMIKEKDLPTGFYDQLCSGKIKLYARRIKEFQETIFASKIERNFIEKSKYYISKDGHYYPIRSKKSVLNVLGDRKRELNQFIHQNHLRFHKDREITISKLTEFYNGN